METWDFLKLIEQVCELDLCLPPGRSLVQVCLYESVIWSAIASLLTWL